jgi:hypothetical protein
MHAQSRSEASKNSRPVYGKKPMRRLPGGAARQRGSVMLWAALSLPVVLGLAGLAVDMGRAYSAQRELRSAASAAAMAGVGCLYAPCSSPSVSALQAAPYTAPFWKAAAAQALIAAQNNSVMGTKLQTAQVITPGYYDTSSLTMTPYTALAASFTPSSTQVPAVQVNISTGGQNATLNTAFAAVLGIKTITVNSDGSFGSPPSSPTTIPTYGINPDSVAPTNSAGATCPSTSGTNVVAPIAISKCMYDSYYWKDGEDDDDGDGVKDGPHPKRDPSTHEPYDFHIGPQQVYYPNGQCSQSNGHNHDHNRQCSQDNHDESYWYNNAYQCTSGGWTGFDSGHEDDDSIKSFITKRNPNKLTDDSGGKPSNCNKSSSITQSLYDAVNSCSASGDKSCEYMMIPVLDTSSSPSASSSSPITGFACVHVESADRDQGCVHTKMVAPGTKDSNGNVVCSPTSTSTGTSTGSSTGVSKLCYGLKGGGPPVMLQ